MGQIDHELWKSIVPDLIYIYDQAIPTKWREERDAGNYLGIPCTPEIAVEGNETNGAVEMGFTSGVTIHWDADSGTYLC